ncbi:DUF2470 domain-containing protein [Microbacterium invictum]|uniref:DUF2470 domain-containing protein n=1 Tax=Microbacterium invictum TaxID=515415 RepID=A0ABZ0VA98_9MICO|nr:DUF2470 domain-containing protein [Microbacterium invictum]WQB70266.1 DUF2470 domain-containing protein [Microbacterium invictum]
MTHRFDESAVAAILRHMNDDHRDDNLLIVRAFGPAGTYRSARMTGLDGAGGDWAAVTEHGDEVTVRVDWPGGAITERPEVRREIVALYDEACRRLGVTPRPH